jgi:hypothetical protein
VTTTDPRQDLERALVAGAASEVLLDLVEAIQVAGQSFGEIETWLYGLAGSGLPPPTLARLEAFLDEEFDTATELVADGVRYWTFLHHHHGEEVGFGESVSLKAVGRPGYGLFLLCRPGEYPELEPLRVDDGHVLLGVDGRLRLGAGELAELRRRHQQIPLFEEAGERRLIDRLTSALRDAPFTAYSVSEVGTAPETWRLSVGGRWREVAVKAAEALAREGVGGSLTRL